jgi:hypothetical protein
LLLDPDVHGVLGDGPQVGAFVLGLLLLMALVQLRLLRHVLDVLRHRPGQCAVRLLAGEAIVDPRRPCQDGKLDAVRR